MRLLDRIKSKMGARGGTPQSSETYQSTMAKLVALQLMTRFEKPSEAFSTLSGDMNAAGYLYGFHDAYAQYLYGRDPQKCFPEIKASYEGLFGQSAGNDLFLTAAVDRERPEFQLGMLQGGNEMYAYIEQDVRPVGLMCHLVLGSQAENSPALKFVKTTLTWDREQGRIALALFIAMMTGDRGPIESLFGKGAKLRTAYERLTVAHVRVLQATLEEMAPEIFDGFTSDDGDDQED